MILTWRRGQYEDPSSALPHAAGMPADMQDLDKKDALAEKQRESMMVGLSKTKTELGSLQDALAKTQVELEKTSFELHAKKSKRMSPVLVLPQSMPSSIHHHKGFFGWCRHNSAGWLFGLNTLAALTGTLNCSAQALLLHAAMLLTACNLVALSVLAADW